MDSLRLTLTVTQREVRDQMRDWRIVAPIVLLTILFPGLMNFVAQQMVGFVERYGAPVIGDRILPFLMMIVGFFPISISLVIALEVFVGEQERRSIEPLLISPLTDLELYLGKLLAAMAPPLVGSYLGIGVYLIGIWYQIGWLPSSSLLLQILLLTTVQAMVMVSGAVVVSSQTTSVRAANLLASFIIIPMTFLLQGEAMVMFWGQYSVLWWIIAGLALIAGLLTRTGLAHFNREELLGRELDSVNLRWGWRVFRQAFWGNSRSIFHWYFFDVGKALWRLVVPLPFMAAALLIGFAAGVQQADAFRLPPNLLDVSRLDQGFIQGLESLSFFSIAGVGAIWLQNLRAIALATLLGIFSFGVIGILILMLPMVIVGYFAANMASVGVPPLTFLAALVLPHGSLEIPAILIAGAAIFRIGATLAAPGKGQTIGESWVGALADWAKVMLAVVMPLLLAAAVLEVYVTPYAALWIFGR